MYGQGIGGHGMTRNNVITRGYGHKKDSQALNKQDKKLVRTYDGFYLGVASEEAFVGLMQDTVSILVADGDTYLQKLQIEPGVLTGTTYSFWESLGMIEEDTHSRDSWQCQGRKINPNEFIRVDVLNQVEYVPGFQQTPVLACVAWRSHVIANNTSTATNHANEPIIWVTGKSNPDLPAWGFKLVNLILAGLGTKGNTAAITICGAFTVTYGKSMASCYRESGYNPVKLYEQVVEVPTLRSSLVRVQKGILENPQLWLGLDRDLEDDCLCFWLTQAERMALRETVPLFTVEDTSVTAIDPTTTFVVGRRVVSTKQDSSCWGNLQHLGIVDSEFQQKPVTKMLPPIKQNAVIVTA